MKMCGLIALAIAFNTTTAHADPFNINQGEARIDINGSYTASPSQFNNDGHVYRAPAYNQVNISAAGEYGLSDDVNILIAPSFRSINVPGPNNSSTGLGFTDVGARYRVGKGSNWVFALQALARIPGTGRNYGVAQIGNNAAQFDLRALSGYTFGKSFVTLEGSYRFRGGSAQNEVHVDVGIGTRPTPRLLLLASMFNTFADGRGSGIYDYKYNYHDLYLSAVYELNRHVAVQLGVTGTVAGRNALRQRGPVASLWFKL